MVACGVRVAAGALGRLLLRLAPRLGHGDRLERARELLSHLLRRGEAASPGLLRRRRGRLHAAGRVAVRCGCGVRALLALVGPLAQAIWSSSWLTWPRSSSATSVSVCSARSRLHVLVKSHHHLAKRCSRSFS